MPTVLAMTSAGTLRLIGRTKFAEQMLEAGFSQRANQLEWSRDDNFFSRLFYLFKCREFNFYTEIDRCDIAVVVTSFSSQFQVHKFFCHH